MSPSLTVRPIRSQDERSLILWLSMQQKVYTRFAAQDMASWLSAGHGLLAEHDREPVGLLLYNEASRVRASVAGVAVDHDWPNTEVFPLLFQKAAYILQRHGFSVLLCVTDADWLGTDLRQYAEFNLAGHLVSYLKVDWDIPEFGNCDVHVGMAAPDDIEEILNIDKSAFPALWQQGQHFIFPSYHQHEYLFKAEWCSMIVGYASGAWHNQHGHISRLAVHPQLQKQGIGKRLLAESISHFHREGIYRITLNTQADNTTSRKLYERYRFRAINSEIQVLVRTISHSSTDTYSL